MPTRIMVADDQPATIDRLATGLSTRGYAVARHMVDRVTFLDVLHFRPHLMIIDGFSAAAPHGVDLMQRVWLEPTTAAIRFIVTTAPTPRLLAMHQLLEAKGIDVVVKPYRLETMLVRVERIELRSRRS